MPISLRCPGCGKAYQLRDDLAGKQAKCKCGAAMKVPAAGPAKEDTAWEDKVIRAFGPPGATEPQEERQGETQPAPPGPAGEPAGAKPASRPQAKPASPAPQKAGGAVSPKPKKADEAPSSRFARVWHFVKDEVPRLFRSDPWRAVFGLVAVVYGSVAAVAFLVPAVRPVTLGGLLFGDVTVKLAQTVLAGIIAVGGMLILKKHRHGPACAGLAAVLLCFVPTWGLLPDLHGALDTKRFLPLLWLAARYAVPIALMVWCLKEETRRERKEGQE